MALSHRDQRALEQIAIDLSADDPRLATTLARGRAATRWRKQIAAALLFVAGMAMQASAILIPPSVTGGVFGVSLLGYVVMFGAALLFCKIPSRRRRRATFHTDAAGPET